MRYACSLNVFGLITLNLILDNCRTYVVTYAITISFVFKMQTRPAGLLPRSKPYPDLFYSPPPPWPANCSINDITAVRSLGNNCIGPALPGLYIYCTNGG